MTDLDYQILYQNDRPAFAVVPYDQFSALLRELNEQPVSRPTEVLRLRDTHQISMVKAWRLYRNLTQTAVAQRAGVSQPALAQMEKKGASLQQGTLKKLALALDVDAKQLLD